MTQLENQVKDIRTVTVCSKCFSSTTFLPNISQIGLDK